MNPLDENIVEAMNQYKKEEYGDIYKGIYMKEELIEFEEVKLFEDKVSVMLPKTFVDMPQKLAELKYPSQFRPQIIKMNETTDVNIMFNLTAQEIENKDIVLFTKQIRESLKKIQPANVFMSMNTITSEENTIGWFDFKSHSIDEKIYNIMSFHTIGKNMMQVSFGCRFIEYKLWKSVALQVIGSVKELANN